VRRLALNLLTVSGTLALLVLLTLPAWSGHSDGDPRASAAAPPEGRLLGVYLDPWHVSEWRDAVGVKPNLIAKFESFSRRRTPARFLEQTERDGVAAALISWEPWTPVPARLGWQRQAQTQRGYTNAEIAAGAQDAYITSFARSAARFPGVVYIRYAHEMNGFWYPWSANAPAYIRAWRRTVRLFRAAGAHNARFVWSVNPNLYEARSRWMRNMRRYWPGARWVDAVGSTMINFGGDKHYTIGRFEPALVSLHRAFRKPVILTETNTELAGHLRWLRDLRSMLGRRSWVRAVVWSQLPSRGAAQQRDSTGDLSWDVARDPAAAQLLREIARDG
jgi:Glycosyl hydrolase family 26